MKRCLAWIAVAFLVAAVLPVFALYRVAECLLDWLSECGDRMERIARGEE